MDSTFRWLRQRQPRRFPLVACPGQNSFSKMPLYKKKTRLTWYLGWWRNGESGPTESGRSSSLMSGRSRIQLFSSGAFFFGGWSGLLRASTESSPAKWLTFKINTFGDVLNKAVIFRFSRRDKVW